MTELLPMLVVGIVAGAPLLAAALTSCFGRHFSRSRLHWPASVGAALSLAGSVVAIGLLCGTTVLPQQPLVLYRWVTLPGNSGTLSVALQLDALSALFLAVSGIVTLVVLLHHATTTTTGESARLRFFAGASALQFATVMLLLATDWITFFCFWQLTALAGWLIAPSDSRTAADESASTRSYMTLRVADVVMLIGLFLFFNKFATFGFAAMMPTADNSPYAVQAAGTSMQIIGLCLFLAAATRCSLFPLMTGRQSARVGCHATNALLESALMMPVGVYLVARSLPLIAPSPAIVTLLICMGSASAIAGSISAAVQSEPRRRLSAAAISLFGMAVLGLATGTKIGSTAALLLVSVQMLAMTGLWLSTSEAARNSHAVHPAAASPARWAFAANALVLCSGVWGQHTILMAVAQMARGSKDPLLGQLILVAYCCAMASLPCLAFAMVRGFSALQSQTDTTSDLSSPAARSSRAAEPWSLWVPPFAAAIVPPLLFGLPGRFDATAIMHSAAGEEFGLGSLLTVDVGLPLVLLGAVVAWLSRSSADSPRRRAGRSLNSVDQWTQNNFGLPQLWTVVVARPLRVLAHLCRLVDVALLDAAWKTLPGRLVTLPARLAGSLQTGQVQFYLLSVLLATALLLLALTGSRG